LAADPELAPFEVFLFPDRNDLFDAIDNESARIERFAPMRR
jgi:hypothetical protein